MTQLLQYEFFKIFSLSEIRHRRFDLLLESLSSFTEDKISDGGKYYQ